MKKNTSVRFAGSLILLPMMATMSMSAPQMALNQKSNIALPTANILALGAASVDQSPSNEEVQAALLAKQAEAIDSYFAAHDMPLEGMGMKMAQEADKNDLDWRLIPAIAVRESTGGKFACTRANNNPFGWASCKMGFKTMDTAIETIARNLGGNNPKTAHHYDNKTTKQILQAYNPPSIVPKYAEQVMSIMNTIGIETIEVAMATS